MSSPHLLRVRKLYKTVLRLHRGLPSEMQELGDQYVKSEFRLHKTAEEAYANQFMIQWTNYAIDLTKQLGLKGVHRAKKLGASFDESGLEELNADQLGQLYELYKSIDEYK